MATKHEFIVILPDHDGALARRMKVRQDHLKNLSPKVDSGFWTFGGALLSETIRDGEGPKIKGSIMLALADSEEQVMEQIRSDIYCKEDIWDMDKVQIFPFKTAIRKPL